MSAELLTQWARLLFESFATAGLRDVVISPGSRSVPFTLAAVNTRGLSCHIAVDERAAAFFALGQARVTGRPSLLICTSGSAAAHYYPAVVEAAADHVPLLALTADRPPELHACGAAQTMDQQRLFAGFCRQFFELGTPDDSRASLRALRRVAAQALFATLHPQPGPVQINARARKPLEPVEPERWLQPELTSRVQAVQARPPVRAAVPRSLAPREALGRAAASMESHARGLIVCGPLPIAARPLADALFRLARSTGYPLLLEATSQFRFAAGAQEAALICDGFDRLLGVPEFVRAEAPEFVLQIGAPPVSSAFERLLAEHPDIELIVLGEHGFRDPSSQASELLIGDLAHTLHSLVELVQPRTGSRAERARLFAERYRRANAAAWEVIEEYTRQSETLTEGAVARSVVNSVPPGSLLFLGNSLPIRLVDGFCQANDRQLRVLSQRGLNGIDGGLAGLAGSARASGLPATALIGDLSFLHDLSSLALFSAPLGQPVLIVVVQNSGGRIFEQLPIAGVARPHEAPFVYTPQPPVVEAAAAAFGAAFERVHSVIELEQAAHRAHQRPGVTLVEAVVPPHGAAADARRIAQRLRARLQADEHWNQSSN